jgi:L-alanine-DL-glutamate epimerase-like enolase superfamily enzyme
MNIAEVRSWRVVIRRATAWKTARYTKGDIDALVVGIGDSEGNMGYGYMPSQLLEGESAPAAEQQLHAILKPILMKQTFPGIQPLMKELDLSLLHNHQLKFAIESALLDLTAKRINTPLYNLIGGLCMKDVPVMRMLGLKPPQETAAEALAFVEKGYRYIKLKVGVDKKRDIAAFRAVREAVGPDIFLSIDANRSYSVMQTIRIVKEMEPWDLGIVEQPIRADDVHGMAFIRQHITTPLMADEAVLTPTDVKRLIEADAIDAVSIKLWKVGGFFKAKEIAAICNTANIGCHVASTPGSMLMEAGQLHFAASTLNMIGGAEIGEFDGLMDDPASGLTIVNGTLRPPVTAGLGVTVDLSKARETEV